MLFLLFPVKINLNISSKVLLAAVEGAGKVSCPFPVICRTLVSCPWSCHGSSVVPCTTVHSVLQVQRLKNGHRNIITLERHIWAWRQFQGWAVGGNWGLAASHSARQLLRLLRLLLACWLLADIQLHPKVRRD